VSVVDLPAPSAPIEHGKPPVQGAEADLEHEARRRRIGDGRIRNGVGTEIRNDDRLDDRATCADGCGAYGSESENWRWFWCARAGDAYVRASDENNNRPAIFGLGLRYPGRILVREFGENVLDRHAAHVERRCRTALATRSLRTKSVFALRHLHRRTRFDRAWILRAEELLTDCDGFGQQLPTFVPRVCART